MTKLITMRPALALVIFVMGNLQAWDSDVPAGGLLIVFLVSLAIALPAIALLVADKSSVFLGVFALAFGLLIAARLVSPIPLPGLFLVLIPAAMGLIFTGSFRSHVENPPMAKTATPENS